MKKGRSVRLLPSGMNKFVSKNMDIDEFVINIHHEFMKTYGWIPLEEFKNMPIPTFWNLWERVVEDRKQAEKIMKKRRMRGR